MSAAEEILERLKAGRGLTFRLIADLEKERPELFEKVSARESAEEREAWRVEREAYRRLLRLANPSGNPEQEIELTGELAGFIAKSLSRTQQRAERAVEILREEAVSLSILPLGLIESPEALDSLALEYNSATAALLGKSSKYTEQLELFHPETGEVIPASVERYIVAKRRLSPGALRLAAYIGGLWYANSYSEACGAPLGKSWQHAPDCLHRRRVVVTSWRSLARALYGDDGSEWRSIVRKLLAEIESTPLDYIEDFSGSPRGTGRTGYLIEGKGWAKDSGKGRLALPLGFEYHRLMLEGRVTSIPRALLDSYDGAHRWEAWELGLTLAALLRPKSPAPGKRFEKTLRIARPGADPGTLGFVGEWLREGETRPGLFREKLDRYAARLAAWRDPKTGEGSPLLLGGIGYKPTGKSAGWQLAFAYQRPEERRAGQLAAVRGAGQLAAKTGAISREKRGSKPQREGQLAARIVRESAPNSASIATNNSSIRGGGKTPESARRGNPRRVGEIIEETLGKTSGGRVEITLPPGREDLEPEPEEATPSPTLPEIAARWGILSDPQRRAYRRAYGQALEDALTLDRALLPEEPSE